MRIRKILIVLIIIFIVQSLFVSYYSYASGLDGIKEGMKGVSDPFESAEGTGLVKVMNNIIFIIQVAGGGISLIVVTMLGIKYMVASVEEKAEVKKQAMPILIGCVLLFGSVAIISLVGTFATKVLPEE